MDIRFTQLHANVLELIKKGGPKGLAQQAIQPRIDQAYRPKKLGPDALFTVPLGAVLEHLVLDGQYAEPFNPNKGVRDITSTFLRITPAGNEALEQWAQKSDEEKRQDSTPVDVQNQPMADPILPADSTLRQVSVKDIEKMADGKGSRKKPKVSSPAAKGAIPRRKAVKG